MSLPSVPSAHLARSSLPKCALGMRDIEYGDRLLALGATWDM